MKLNARLQTAQKPNRYYPIVLLHGLFGSLDNLGVLARDLRKDRTVLLPDLRNHGLSPRSEDMSYAAMATDVLDTMDDYGIEKATLIGHSMGGKVVMTLTAIAPQRIDKVVIIDIAPVDYQVRRHDKIFAAIRAVTETGVTARQQAARVMGHDLENESVIQFLLKSFDDGEWKFNVPVLQEQYGSIVGWQAVPPWQHPTLFICGGHSPYVDESHRKALLRQFPQARAYVVAGAGHWVHAEKPDAVLRAIHRFIDTAPTN